MGKANDIARLTVLLLGAAVTILSAVLTGYHGERHQRALQDVRGQVMQQERLLAERWQDAQSLRHREDSVVLLAAALARADRPADPELGVLLAHYMERTLAAADAPASIAASVTAAMKNGKAATAAPYESALSAIESRRRTLLAGIDELYLRAQSLRREEEALQERDTRLRTLALFCQIMGLILVLAARGTV